MRQSVEKILFCETGWGSMQRVGLTPDGREEVQKFSHATAMGSLLERYKYSQLFGKPLPTFVQRFHPLVIAKLCRYCREVGMDVETVLTQVEDK